MLKGFLCLMLFTTVPSWVAARPAKDSFTDKAKAGIDFGFGLPYAWLSKQETKYGTVTTSPNISLGVTLGYSFPLVNNLKISPELGINYGFTRRFKSVANINLEEEYIQIPIAVKLYAFDEEGSYSANGLCLGYEFDVAISSKYKERGQDIADISRPAGALFFGGTLDLPMGFYIVGKFKFPSEWFMERNTLNAVRMFSTSFVELNLGIDILKLL